MKTIKNKKYGAMTKIARSFGLKGKQGIYSMKDGTKIDLTATAPNKNDVLKSIALQLIKFDMFLLNKK